MWLSYEFKFGETNVKIIGNENLAFVEDHT